ncbi:interleukin-18-like [Channa argus]|uniref:interleukin-18-like n=1 Tax=Channa argus TaxID=215402 RepID=UPI003522CDC2
MFFLFSQVVLMAALGCSSVLFFDTCSNGFYFEMEPADVYEDAFNISTQCPKCLIKSKDNKFLLLKEDQFQAQNLTTTESGCSFHIQIYKNNELGGDKGRPVILYANKDGKKMVVCCNEKEEICPVAMDLPNNIVETSHKAVFYLTDLKASNMFLFESSVYQYKFLGFEPDEHRPFLSKLVLQEKNYDEVVDSCEITISNLMS